MLDINIQTQKSIFANTNTCTLTFSPGEIVALLGQNGAGKTTLIKEIVGISPFYRGEILLDGEPLTQKNLHRIAYGSSENSFFGELTALEQKEFYQMNFPNFNEKRFDLLVDYFKLPVNRQMRYLSQGEKNQLETVFALSQGADYIFLDEPFANNDILRRKDFYKLLLGILEEHECLILVTHLVEEINHLVSRAIYMDNFNIIDSVNIEELEDKDMDIVTWFKQKSNYSDNKVSSIIQKLEEN